MYPSGDPIVDGAAGDRHIIVSPIL